MPTELSSAGRIHDDGSSHATVRTVLRLAGVAALLVSAIVHAVLAPSYGAGQPGITLGTQFVVQAVGTGAVAIWLLIRDSRLAWLIGAVLMGGTAAALVKAHTGNGLPAIGPMPAIREMTYDTPQLVTLAVEIAFVVLAAVRLLLDRRH